jgi:hypothetical protein
MPAFGGMRKRCLALPGVAASLMRRLAAELFEHHLDLARNEVIPFGGRVVETIRFPTDPSSEAATVNIPATNCAFSRSSTTASTLTNSRRWSSRKPTRS